MKRIKNNVPKCPTIPLDDLVSLHGNLKKATSEDLLKLRNGLISKGIIFPLFVWQDKEKNVNWLIDGVHRIICLRELRDMGYEIDPIPLVPIKAKNKRQAKKLILLATGHYSKITKQGFNTFVEDLDIGDFIGELNYTDIKLEFHIPEEEIDSSEIDTTVQFMYSRSELSQVEAFLQKLRDHYELEKDIDIISRVLKNAKSKVEENV